MMMLLLQLIMRKIDYINPNRTEVVDLPEDLVINLNNEQGGENGKK